MANLTLFPPTTVTREFTIDELRVFSTRVIDANNRGFGAGYGLDLQAVTVQVAVTPAMASALDRIQREMDTEAAQRRRFLAQVSGQAETQRVDPWEAVAA